MSSRFALRLLALLLILPALAVATDVYVVPFSHLDLYWAGTREECLSRGNRIITKAIRMAQQYPQFRFLLEDEVFIANYVETHQGTADLDALKRLVKEGRIELAPKWAGILQNLPRGEAHVRNMVYGKQYARRVFGVDPQVANLGDLPGYTSQFPQILARSRVPYMVMTRMGPADKSMFYYKAPDGSRALVWNTLKGYGWGTFITSKTLTDEQKQARFQKDLGDLAKSVHGGPILMNWGTDLWAPADDLVPAIQGFKAPAGVQIKFASPSEFFHLAEKNASIPTTSGEIPHAWANILSSIADTWPPAIAGTDMLVTAEKFSAINHALGYAAYPQQDFEILWKRVLEAQDHNNYGQGGANFGGDARKLEYGTQASIRGGEILRDMLRNIAERVKSPFPRSMPIVVFNPMSWTRDDVVHAHVSLYGDASPGDIPDYRKGVRLVDETGAAVPLYVERSSGTVSRGLEVFFVARGVPSLGYKAYFIVPTEKPDEFPNAAQSKLDEDPNNPKRTIGEDKFENQFYRVTVDRITGGLTILDKELNRVVAKNVEIAALEERGGDTLSKEVMSGRDIVNAVRAVDVEENNAVRTVVRIQGELGGTPVTQRVILYSTLKRIDLENTVDWKHSGRLMKIEQVFPYEHPDAQIQYGTPFGSVSGTDFMPGSEPRANDEIGKDFWKQWRQIHDWIWAGTAEYGLTIASDRQVVTVAPGAIRAGMFRSAYSAIIVTRDGKPTTVHMPPEGKYVFHYSLTSGKGDWKAAKAYRAGMGLNNPLIPVAVADELSQKLLPPTNSFVSLESGNLVVSALKKSETDGAVVLRVFDMEGTPAATSIDFLGSKASFREVNMLEEDAGPADQRALQVKPYEIRTLKLQQSRD